MTFNSSFCSSCLLHVHRPFQNKIQEEGFTLFTLCLGYNVTSTVMLFDTHKSNFYQSCVVVQHVENHDLILFFVSIFRGQNRRAKGYLVKKGSFSRLLVRATSAKSYWPPSPPRVLSTGWCC